MPCYPLFHMTHLTLPLWWDCHAHLRQGDILAPLIAAHVSMGCAGVVSMPNTAPPVSRIFESDAGAGWSIEGYMRMLHEARGGNTNIDFIVPLYLTADITPDRIEQGAQASLLRAAKYYPPHGTTGSAAAADVKIYEDNGVFAALEAVGAVLCIHGEVHAVSDEDYFTQTDNAETLFYRTIAPHITQKYPRLRFVAEHITTSVAADFVQKGGEYIGATITPQHLLYTTGHLLRGLRYHLHCMPVAKFASDRSALRALAATHPRTFAGTDSAPHARKVTQCGCAAGCFTAGVAPQLYAMAFEESGLSLDDPDNARAFEAFLCTRGPTFWNLPKPQGQFVLKRKDATLDLLPTPQGPITSLPLGMGLTKLPWSVSLV